MLVASDRIGADYPQPPSRTRARCSYYPCVVEQARRPRRITLFTDVPDEVAGRAVLVQLRIRPSCVARLSHRWRAADTAPTDTSPVAARRPSTAPAARPVFTPSAPAPAETRADVRAEVEAIRQTSRPCRDLTVATRAATKLRMRHPHRRHEGRVQGRGRPAHPRRRVLADSAFAATSGSQATQPSTDKEFVREWLMSAESGWDKDSQPTRCPRTPSNGPGEVRRGLRADHRPDLRLDGGPPHRLWDIGCRAYGVSTSDLKRRCVTTRHERASMASARARRRRR